jgi:hypothetical protein
VGEVQVLGVRCEMKLYAIIGGDGFVFDITTNLPDTRKRVRSAVGALEGCTVAQFSVPQDLANVRALFFHTFGKRVPVVANVVNAWFVTKRGAMRPMPISDYEGFYDRLQRRVLGAQKAPRRHVESYFDPRLADGDDVLPIDSVFGDLDVAEDVRGDAEAAIEGGEVDDDVREGVGVSEGAEDPSVRGPDSQIFSDVNRCHTESTQ